MSSCCTWCVPFFRASCPVSRNGLSLPGDARVSRPISPRSGISISSTCFLSTQWPSRKPNSAFSIRPRQTAAARCAKSSRSFARSLPTTCGSPACADSSQSHAPTCRPEESSRCPGPHAHKLSPLAEWSTRDVWQYAESHRFRYCPLYEKGYTSIGCEPCTSLPFDADDPRSGRWSGRKLECGIHIQATE